jgi:alpha-ketoglutarate-dependent taurine dioxygenase
MTHSISNKPDFPTIIERSNDQLWAINECLKRKADFQKKLLKSGALLFRGWLPPTPVQFAQFVRQFSGRPLQRYVGGASPRRSLTDGVYTSTEYSPEITLSLHNEMSYTYLWPNVVCFGCVIAPTEGGETPIADSRALLARIGADIVKEFSKKQIRYSRRFSSLTKDGYSWQDAFETDSRQVVEKHCERGKIAFEWQTDGTLLLTETRPATATHPLTRDEVWFNQAESFHSNGSPTSRLDACFGDGSKIDERSLMRIREAIAEHTILFKWQPGDILMLDNLLTAHGRRPFVGPREILVAMA